MLSFCLVSGLYTFGKWEIAGNEIRSWSHAMSGDVHYGLNIGDYSMFDQYDITMIELTETMLDTAINLKRFSKTKVVGLVEGELMNRNWSTETFNKYIQVLNIIDLVGIINDKAYDIMKYLTDKPIRMIGIPYPLRWTMENSQEKTTNNIIELGSTPKNRGGIWTMTAFNQLNVSGIAYTSDEEDNKSTMEISNGRLSLGYDSDWQTYYKEHSKYFMGLHLDDRATWGRFPLDCASANMPCVSTSGSYTQKILFPELTVEYYEISKAVSLCKRLMEDKSFLEYCLLYAKEHINQFDLEPTKQRFLKVMEEI